MRYVRPRMSGDSKIASLNGCEQGAHRYCEQAECELLWVVASLPPERSELALWAEPHLHANALWGDFIAENRVEHRRTSLFCLYDRPI